MSSPLLFNFEDFKEQANAYLENVRQQGRQILEQAVAEANAEREAILQNAQNEVDKAVENGFQQGFQQGLDEGREKQKEEIAKGVKEGIQTELQTTSETLRKLLEGMERARFELAENWERHVLKLAAKMAERVIRQELKQTPQIETNWIRESLQLCSGENAVTLFIHPDDAELLNDALEELQMRFRHLGKIEIRQDAALTRGDCIVETEHGQIDTSVEAQLERIVEELS